MRTTFTVLDQGTTFAWTQAYGDASPRERAREALRDALFAVALLVLVTGVAGFMAYPSPLHEYARASEARAIL